MIGTKAVVLDNGSYTIKAGVSGEVHPQVTIPTLVGRPRHALHLAASNRQSVYHGAEAYRRRGIMALRRPVHSSIIANFDDMESLWTYIYDTELQLLSLSQPVLMTDSPVNGSQNRWRMAQIAFEAMNVPALNISNTAPLALYANGRTSGIVVDIGEDVTHVTPILQGVSIRGKTRQMCLGGRDVAEFVASTTPETLSVARDILFKTGYVALDYKRELDAYLKGQSRPPDGVQERYELPDRGVIELGDPPFRAPELLFQPLLREHAFLGVNHQVHSCISSLDRVLHRELYSNIVLSGGGSNINGLPLRLAKEVSLLAEEVYRGRIDIVAPEGRELATWIGGSVISSLRIFEGMIATKLEWEESGERIITQKFVL